MQLTFQKPAFRDRAWVRPLLEAERTRACDYNFGNIYLWSRVYPQEITRLDERVLVRVEGRLGSCYLFPAGRGALTPALDALHEDAARSKERLTLVCVTGEQKDRLEAELPGRFSFEPDRDGFDYLYHIDRLADLQGKKLHGKRNHIHRFEELCPDWRFEPLTRDNIPECVAFERDWAASRTGEGQSDGSISEESIAVIEALYHMEELGMEGGLIRSGDSVVGFSLGSFVCSDCFDVQFEKAAADIPGAYPIINREMARIIRAGHPEIQWLNREDDLGLEGLRRAKLSYCPDILLEKYVAREI